jgi:hypothetical protein
MSRTLAHRLGVVYDLGVARIRCFKLARELWRLRERAYQLADLREYRPFSDYLPPDAKRRHAFAALGRDLTDLNDHARSLIRIPAADRANGLYYAIYDTRELATDLARETGAAPAAGFDDSIPLAYDLNRAAMLAASLCKILNRATIWREQGEEVRLAPAAERLLAVACRALPAADRTRYAEEYESELRDLARLGDGRLRQLQYALRQLFHAISMIHALRSLRRRSAMP